MNIESIFSEKELGRYAEVMVWALESARRRNGGWYKKGDVINLKTELAGLSLAEEIYRVLVSKGRNVSFRMLTTEKMSKCFFDFASPKQIKFVGDWEKQFMESIQGTIFIYAPRSLTHLKEVDPKKIGNRAKALKPIRDIFSERSEKGEAGWTLCAYPTEELAKQANKTVEEYKDQIIRACFLDKKDPIAKWKYVMNQSRRIASKLNKMGPVYMRVESENTDLKIFVGDRRNWLSCDGNNIPSFEIFTSPDWRKTEGVYYANMPSFRTGNYVENVRLVFKKGRVVEAKSKQGENYLKEVLKTDKGASQIGEFSLTDKRFSRINEFMASTLFDENFGGDYGNCHIALGDSYGETFSEDSSLLTVGMKRTLGYNSSAIHWDIINTENKTVTAYLSDGSTKVIYEKGEFII